MPDALIDVAERQEPTVTFHDVMNVVRRHGWWIATATVLSAALVAAALWHMTPRYIAKAAVILDVRRPSAVGLPGSAPAQPGVVDPAVVRSEVSQLLSAPVAIQVIQALRLDELPEFRRPGLLRRFANDAVAYADSLGLPARASVDWLRSSLGMTGAGDPSAAGDPLDEMIRAYQRRLTVANDGRSYLIGISFLSEDPVLAARVANAHVAAYAEWQTERKRDASRTASAWLNDELGALQARVQAAEEAVQKFREANQIVSIPSATISRAAPNPRGDTVLAQRLAELHTQLTLTVAERSSREARLDQARNLVRRREADRVSEVGGSPLIQRLREQEALVLRREAELRNRLGLRHPEFLATQAELRDLQGAIGAEIQRILEGLANEVGVARAREADLRTSIAALEQRFADTARAEITLRELEREAAASRSLYENLLAQRQLLGVQQGMQQPDVGVVSQARVPTRPSSPQILRDTGIAAGFVGLLMTALAFAREFLFRGIRGVMDLEQVAGLRCLGTVPLLRRRLASGRQLAHAMDQTHPRFADSIRSLRAAVSLPKTLLITSALSEEGKSTISVAVGRSLARAGYSVLLLDADLRHPSVAAAMGDGSSDGWLNDALVLEEGSGTWPTVWPVRADRWSRLQYMASRQTAEAAPQDLLASPAMHGVLERAAHEYDIVLVDSPPVLAAADALILASQVEATLVVVRWRRTPRDALALAVSQITRAGGRLIGAVLNEVDVEHGVFDHGDPEAYRQGAVARYYGARGAV